MLYLLAPWYFPEYRWFMGAMLSVEINSWFLICRRVVYSNNSTAVHPHLATAVSAMFYLTWIVIRCILYPYFLVVFVKMAEKRVGETGVYFHKEMIFIVVHAALCALNLKWTYDLFTPIIKRWMGSGPKSLTVQNGL